ncbi:MAG: HEAT repeat domain-containing protein [Opitutaceae bacterium]|nr:HEAT repeat domain-containing protein [Opitutaceae bacterium]
MIASRLLVLSLVALALAGCTTPARNPASTAALAVLASEAGVHEKARACQELGVFGGPESVPALARLLNHEVLADYARSGLEGISDPSAGQALRQALGSLEGRNLAGVVNSLGVRRERSALPELQALALDPKRGVAAEAMASLGMIGTVDASKTLQQILKGDSASQRVPAAHAALVAAEHLVRAGNPAFARDLLNDVIHALPAGSVTVVAQRQLDALKGRTN